MTISRRKFLKLAGASALLAAGCESVGDAYIGSAPGSAKVLPGPKALRAKRWAMAIDMRKFSGPDHVRRVIAGCHKAHNVPDIGDPGREIKWIWTDSFEHAFPGTDNRFLPAAVQERPVLLLCNHCANPPCVRVCPTGATFQREDGIVMMDYHRCIGCRFCMAGCPYGSRSFNFWDPRPYVAEVEPKYPTRTKGVVEKCDFCIERLAEGLPPVCVELSDGAMVFGDLDDPQSEVRKVLASHYTIQRKPQLGTEPGVYYVIA
jgi:Fe-S-cluster-containing dehydrogenase component